MPTTISESLDMMTTKMLLEKDFESNVDISALKLSASHILDCVNNIEKILTEVKQKKKFNYNACVTKATFKKEDGDDGDEEDDDEDNEEEDC